MTAATPRGSQAASVQSAGADRGTSPPSDELGTMLEHEAALEARVQEGHERAEQCIEEAEHEAERLEESSRQDLDRAVRELDEELDRRLGQRLERLESRAREAVERYDGIEDEEIARLARGAVGQLFLTPGDASP